MIKRGIEIYALCILLIGCSISGGDQVGITETRFSVELSRAQENGFKGVLGCGYDDCSLLLTSPIDDKDQRRITVQYKNIAGKIELKVPGFKKFSVDDCVSTCVGSSGGDTLHVDLGRGILLLSTRKNPLCMVKTSEDWCLSAAVEQKNYLTILIPRKLDRS